MKKWLSIFLLCMTPVYAEVAFVHRYFQSLSTLEANFEQQDAQKNIQSGQLQIKKNYGIRFEYVKPYRQTVVANQQWLWHYDEDLAQVTQQKIEGSAVNNPLTILFSDQLENYFNVKVIKKEQRYVLTAKSPETLGVNSIELIFNQKELQRIVLTDINEQLLQFSLSKLQRNVSIADEVFKFVPPKGVDVIEQ